MSMVFEIRVTKLAIGDIDEYVCIIRQDSRTRAERWKSALFEEVGSLSEYPNRYAVIPENDEFEFDYRQFIHHSHRVIFRVDEPLKLVYIVRVYHGARRELTARDLPETLN